MATEDEAREAADGTEVQVEAVDLGTVHLQAHPEVKLPSIMEIKDVGEIIDSTEGTLKIPEDQVLVEAPSEVELPPEHNLNGKSSLNGHMDKEENISNEQLHENGQDEAELDGTSAHQSNGINKEEVPDDLSHGESTAEGVTSEQLKHEKDEEPRYDQQNSEGVTVDDDLVKEDTLKTDSSVEQTDDGQQYQNQEPERANKDTQPASIANNADVEDAEVPIGLQTPVEPHLGDSSAVPGTIDENTETEEPAKADDAVHPDNKESFQEDTSIVEPTEEVVNVEDQQTQQADTINADVVQEETLKCEETDVQEDVPKSETHEATTNDQELLNKESAEEIDDSMNEKIEEAAHQSNMAAPKETTPEHDAATGEAPPVNIQVQNQEPSEEIEDAEAFDTEAEMQQSSVAFEDAIPEDQPNLGVTVDNGTVQEDTLKAIEQKDDGQQEQDLEPEKATEDAQPASIANTPDVEVVDEAPSGVQTPLEPNLDNSDAVPDTIDGNTETDEPAKADVVAHPDHKQSSPEDASIAEPTEEVVTVEDQQIQQADAMDADVVQEEMTKYEHADEPATNAHEVLNQESTEETDGPVNEETEESAHQRNMAAPEETTPEHDTTKREPPVNIQVQNQEPLEEIEDAEAAMQQSSVAFEEEIPEDQLNLGITTDGDTVQEDTLETIEQTEDDPQDQEATENTQPASMANIPDVDVVSEAPYEVQTHVEINLDNSDAIPDTTEGNTEIDESAKTEGTTETSEPQVTETEEELKDTEATEAQEITEHGHVTPSKELSAEDDSTADEPHNDDIQQTLGQDRVEVKETVSTSEDTVEDNVTAEEPTCDSQEVDNEESTEETKGNIAENIAEASDVGIVDEAVEEQSVLQTEDISEMHTRELEPEEIKNTEPVESEEPSDQKNAVLFNDLAQEDTPVSEMQQTESATEITETEAAPQDSNDCVSEEPSPEDHMIESETKCDTQEVSIPKSLEVIDGDKDIITGGISGQSNMVSAGESAQENDVPEREPTADIQPVQELEPEEIKNTELVEVKETSHEMNSTVFQTPTEEDSSVTIKLHESARELSNTEATEAGTPQPSDAAQSEEQAPEEIASEPQALESVSVEELNDTEATEPPNISQGNITSASGESGPEEIATEDNITTEPDVDHQQLQDQESACFKEAEADKPQGIASSCTLSTSEQSTSEDNATATEASSDTQEENSEPAEVTEGTENVKSNTVLAEAAAPEEHVETDATAGTSPVQEPELEDTKDAEPAGTEEPAVDSKPKDAEPAGTEEPAVDSEPSVDDQQVHEDKVPEVKENEAMEAEEVIQQSNIAIPDDATEERSELRSDPDSYVHPAQQVELSRDSENSQLIKAEETSGQVNAAAIEETPTEDSAASEIDPLVDIKQEHEHEPVEEIKGIDANEAEEEFHTSPVDAIEKVSEGNIASIEPTPDIKKENELEATKEINGIEAINDGVQTENATTLEDPSPTDNETTPEGHPTELNEETIGNETDNAMLVPGIKDEIQTSEELKDGACDLGETVLTTQGSENVTDGDAVQSPGDDILETSNNINQVKEEQNNGREHNSSEMSGEQNEENILHGQDRDISEEILTKRGTEEASQALFESDPQGAQDVTKEDDTTEGDEQTSYLNRQPDDVALQLLTSKADDLSIARQDEVAQKVDLDQQQKEDEEIESQKEELQPDEQKHEDKDNFTMEQLVEPEDIENGITNRAEVIDACEAEQIEAVITEILKHEEAPHVSEESTPSSMDMKVDNIKGTEEDTDAKNDNKDEEDIAEKDDIVAKDSTDEQDETTDEITNEEFEPGLLSSGQEASDLAPSNDDILENDPEAVTQNVELGEQREDKECTEKVKDDVHTIQASEEEITDEINENKEIRNGDNAIHHDESQTKPEKEEAPQLLSNEPCNVDDKIDDTTTTPGGEIIDGNASINPREIEEIGENKGLDSTSEPLVESSKQNNVEQDLSSHNKVEDEKLSMTEPNDVDIEAMKEEDDEPASDINQTKKCQEETNTDDVQQLEIEENSCHKIDETVSHEKTETSTTEAVTINDNIIDKASGADGGLSDGSIKTFNDTGKDLDVSSVITVSKEESVNENMEDHKLALPAHTAQDETTPEQVLCLEKAEREMPSSEKLLPVEPEENQIPGESNEKELQDENQIPKEKNEEDMQDADIVDAQKDVEQDLPVSHFLMNLILGKKNGDANENSESEAEMKQGETTEDDSYVLIPKQEESLGSLPAENKVDDSLTLEQEKHDVKCSEETQEMVKEKGDDLKLDTERSIHTDDEFNKNTRDLEIPACQGNPQDKISGELLSEEAAGVSTEMETRDIGISNLELEEKAVETVCQENTEVSTKIENGSLDLTNTKASEEDTLGEGQTGLQHESLPEDKSADAVSKQSPLLTESGMIDAKDLSCDAEAVQNLACAKEDEPTESSIIEATSTPDIELECEVEKKEEEQHASTTTGEVSQEDVASSNDNLQKSTSSEVISDEQEPKITEPVSDNENILVHEKEISEGSIRVENFQTAVEIQADGPNMQTNQDKKDEVADNKTTMEPEKLGESGFQEHQETGTEQKSPIATGEDHQQFLVEKETTIKEQIVPGTVESHEQTVSIKSNEEQELFDSKVQERDLNVVSPREASEAEENFVDVTKPEFSTDEEQSPKADAEEKTSDEKIKDVEETKNFTDGTAMKTEAPQKAHKKHNLLSGVGSKVKHQLAKVKKAIVGKPGNAKPDSPKS